MTILECFDPDHDPTCLTSAAKLFARAEACNQLAKLASGRARERLYAFKNRCLQLLRTRFPKEIETRVDCSRYCGLLSIGLKGSKRRRLHSHEAWLPAA